VTDLSICIATWNAAPVLRDCLRSILNSPSRCSFEVIVVDDASSDGTAAMVQEEFPAVRLIVNSQAVGYARSNNQALAVTSGRALLLLNSDTVVLPGALDALFAFLEGEPTVGMVGARLLNADGSLQRSAWRGFPSLRTAAIDALYLWRLAPRLRWVRASEVLERNDGPIEVDHLLGACMMVRREVLEALGGMDESLFVFFADTEWCYRIRQAGWRVFLFPSAQIVHLGQHSIKQNPERRLPEQYQTWVWFYRKHHGSFAGTLCLKALIGLGALIRIALWSWRARSPSRGTQARGMRAGYWKALRKVPFL
jgi:GT2 family glycosyltransferase